MSVETTLKAPAARVAAGAGDRPRKCCGGAAHTNGTARQGAVIGVASRPLPATLAGAAGSGRLVVAGWADLFDTDGVPVPNVPDGVVALVPDPIRTSTARLAPAGAEAGGASGLPTWEGAEHTYIGNNATLHFPSGDVLAGKSPLPLPNGLNLTYGQVLALGGDFYGLPDAPISDDPNPPTRFLAAFSSLATNPNSVAEAGKILAVMQTEINAVNQAIKNGQQPSTVYAALGDTLSGQWNVITGGGSAVSDFFPLGRYLKLAATNWDHFGTHAVTAYQMGHGAAMAQAVAAGKISNPAQQLAALQLAYAMNAFADHFMTDIFSSGHMRTPRKQLYDEVTPSDVGSLLARYMHDEDSCWGLRVKNARGNQWLAYGDKKFFDTVNKANAQLTEAAVQASVDEVYQAFTTGTVPTTWAALTYIPDLAAVSNWNDHTNPAALFIPNAGTVQRRTDPANRFDYSWTSDWWGWSTLALLKTLPEFAACGNTDIPIELNDTILQFVNNNGPLGLNIFAPAAGPGGFGLAWQSPNMGEGPAAVAWLAPTQDDQTNVLQCWNNGGGLGLISYLPDGRGGYKVAWQNDSTGQGAGAIAWLLAPRGTQTDVLQLWNNNGLLGLIVWTYDPTTGGYTASWTSSDMGTGSDALAWVVCEAGDGGTAGILQVFRNGSGVGMAFYTPNGQGGYQFTWTNGEMGGSSSPLAWLPVSQGGQTHLVEAWVKDGLLTLTVWSPDGHGGYVLANETSFYGPTSAVQWLVADALGTGTDNIVQLSSDNNGMLQITTYTWPFNASPFMSTPAEGAGAIGWLTATSNEEGATDIVQLWNNNGALAAIVYTATGTGGNIVAYEVSGSAANLGASANGSLQFFTAEQLD